ncbi:hypothetical protein ACFQZ4_30165 [Catellatospora coxensis]
MAGGPGGGAAVRQHHRHPAALYLGQATGWAALKLLAIQAAWVLALWWGARLIWRRALRALTVHGG